MNGKGGLAGQRLRWLAALLAVSASCGAGHEAKAQAPQTAQKAPGGAPPARAAEGAQPAPAESEPATPNPAQSPADQTTPAEPPKTRVTDAAVKAAVEKAVAYLRQAQNDKGVFIGSYQSYPSGETALALLAMRYAGVGITDPAFQQGLKALLELNTIHTYEVSLVAQALATMPTNKLTPPLRKEMTQLGNFLCGSQLPSGMWTYQPQLAQRGQGPPPIYGDNSNTQFAVLGLWQLEESGIEFDHEALKRCEKHFLESQLANGGWGYTPPASYVFNNQRVSSAPGSTPSMTATGLASLYIFADLLHQRDEGVFSGRSAPACGKAQRLEARIDGALAQAEKDFAAFLEARLKFARQGAGNQRNVASAQGLDLYSLYYLYSVERVGAASGQKFLGRIDWYAAGAEVILAAQNSDGSWGPGYFFLMNNPNYKPPATVVETALAVLFLAKGRAPVIFSKLRYDGDWNNDRRDVANVARYASKALEQHFNWQIVDSQSDVDGWFDSPVLYLSGHEPPRSSDEDRQKLAEYVRRGGFIFAEACCGQARFASAIKELGGRLWPDLQWQELPDDHPLFTNKSHFNLAKHPALWGLTDKQGFTFLVLSSDDVSCIWHQNLIMTQEDAFRFAINVFRYAGRGKPIRPRLAKDSDAQAERQQKEPDWKLDWD